MYRPIAFALFGVILLSSCDSQDLPTSALHQPLEDQETKDGQAISIIELAASSATITVGDNHFSPNGGGVDPGGTVTWNFTGANQHRIKDMSGLNLYDSGLRSAGSTFSYSFVAAGRYPFVCAVHGPQANIFVPLTASPAAGYMFTNFTIVWAAAPAPPGYVYDVQITRGCGLGCTGPWTDWKTGITSANTQFVPDARHGPYQFRSRYRNLSSGNASYYSATALIRITSTAVDDQAATTIDTPISLDIDANDVYEDGLSLRVTGQDVGGTEIAPTAQGGTVSNPNWYSPVTYTPPSGFTGTDTFTYYYDDWAGRVQMSNVATVTVTVTGPQPNQPPNATIDSPAGNVTIQAGQSVTFMGTGTDSDGTVVAFSWSFPGGTPSSSTAEDPGAVIYNTPGNYTATFNVTDNDGASDPSPATRVITVTSPPPPNQAPNATIDQPAGNVTIQSGQSVTFMGTGTDSDGTVVAFSWSFPGGTPSSSNAEDPGVVTFNTPGNYTVTFNVTDDDGAPDPAPATRAITVTSAAGFSVSVTDNAFTPKSATVNQGVTVQWNFNGSSNHTATDKSGMGLFDSGSKAAGTSYSFKFIAAGAYDYFCTLHPTQVGKVTVPIRVVPLSGNTSTTFTVTWSSNVAPAGYVFDVQVKRPNATYFNNWKMGQTGTNAGFVADAGVGTYSLKARLRNTVNGKASLYSPAVSVTVN